MAQPPPQFAHLVSLACHDLRTPLATVQGFAKTLTRIAEVDRQTATYLGMIEAASGQLSELLEDLSVVARVEGGRFDPALREADTLQVARSAAARLKEAEVEVSGAGAAIETEPELAERALHGLARCVARHGGVDRLELRVDGPEARLTPVPAAAAPIVLGEDLRDLGAAVARRVVEALGGSVGLAGETLVVRLSRD